MKIDSTKVKEIMKNLGADLCGIASLDRFPVGTLACNSHVPYTQVRNTMTPKLDILVLRRFVSEDAEAMYKNWASDSEVTKYLTWPTHSSVDISQLVV